MAITFSVIYVAYGAQFVIIDIAKNNNLLNIDFDIFCHSWQFIVGGVIQLILTSTFVVFAFKINQVTKKEND